MTFSYDINIIQLKYQMVLNVLKDFCEKYIHEYICLCVR